MTLLLGLRDWIYVRAIAPVVAILPAWLVYGAALAYAESRTRFDKVAFEEVLLSLQMVLGERIDKEARHKIAKNYFRNRACTRVDAMRLAGDGSRFSRQVTLHGNELIEQALREGKGAMLCSVHYGSIRAGTALLGVRGFPITMITAWSFNSRRGRERQGQRMYQLAWKPIERHMRRPLDVRSERFSVAVSVSAVLRKNELVMSLIDIPTRRRNRKGIQVGFLGKTVNIGPGPALISRATGSPMFVALIRRTGGWSTLRMDIGPRIAIDGEASATMQKCMQVIQGGLWADPSQWELWTMRRLAQFGLIPERDALEYYGKTNRIWRPIQN